LRTREREEAVTKLVMWDLQTQRVTGNKQAYITNAIIINICQTNTVRSAFQPPGGDSIGTTPPASSIVAGEL
jgi:hypothetical protein